MLVSSRFTRPITQSTKSRLDSVLTNVNPMTRHERSRGAVVAVQAALADLNRGYLSQAQVDGYFGTQTAAAVEAFQRDYGLAADGIVGRQTLSQLDALFASDVFRAPSGMSIHVGVDYVDAAHYGDTYPLSACVNDATAFSTLAAELRYDPIVLTNENATTTNFVAAMRQAASRLFSGDYLFVTFSGHGSQLVNTSADEEADFLDETLCFFDRMLIDDELFALLTELRPGVHVTMLYDSCHSQTVSRAIIVENETEKQQVETLMRRRSMAFDPDLLAAEESALEESGEQNRFVPIASDKLESALDGNRPEQIAPKGMKEEEVKEIAEVVYAIRDAKDIFRDFASEKFLTPDHQKIYVENKALYEAVKNVVGAYEDRDVECTVIALSACQDNQTTLDGLANGFYTGNVLSVWDGGGFQGSYDQFHSRLVSQSRPTISPALTTYGGGRARARLLDRPFTF